MSEQLTESDLSLRPNLFGFNLKKFQALLGSNDFDLIERLKISLIQQADELAARPEILNETGKVLEIAVRKGAPFRGLVAESDPHVIAAIILAEHDQELTATGSESWQVSAFWALSDQFNEELEPESRQLFSYFCEGRPLFGKMIETDRSYYGYLTLSELKTLKTELAQLEEFIKDWEDLGTLEFLEDLIGWLSTVVEAEQDLWFYAG